MLPFYDNTARTKKVGELDFEIRWVATTSSHQSRTIDRLVLFVVRVFGRMVIGDLDGIERDDHGRDVPLGLRVREGG